MKTKWGPIVILIVFAMILVLVANSSTKSADRPNGPTDSTLNASVVLSGLEARNTSASFKGGSASSLMGGIDLDLRDAVMAGDEATLNVSAIMGGVDIRVPSSWTVVNHISTIFGGVDNNARSSEGNKRLILEGTVVMGGVDIKN